MLPSIVLLLAGVLAAACGSAGPSSSGSSTPTPVPVPTPTPTPIESPGLAGLGSILSESAASAVSRDGSIVVGRTFAQVRIGFGPVQGFRWTRDDGMVAITPLPPDPPPNASMVGGGATASAVSADGSTIVGTLRLILFDVGPNHPFESAFRWTQSEGYVQFEHIDSPPPLLLTAAGMTPDGAVVVGRALTEDGALRAYRSSEAGVELLPAPAGSRCEASAVSDDGTVVGCCGAVEQPSCSNAIRWDDSAEPAVLRVPPGFEECVARAVSADGTTAAGQCTAEPNEAKAVVWRGDEPEVLADYRDELYSDALGISADGTIVVGSAQTPERSIAFLWTAETGKRSLAEIFAEAGLIGQFTHWRAVDRAVAISADHRVVVGTGIERVSYANKAFRAVLP